MDNADFQKLDHSSLILVFGGGMSVQRPVAERWLAMNGCPITEGYGLSETSPVATAQPAGYQGIFRHDRPCRSRRPKLRSGTMTAMMSNLAMWAKSAFAAHR